MNIERTLETQRHRLLRLVAGLFAVVVFLSVGPFSNAFSRWVGEGVSSILSRAEMAAQFLVVVQARLIAARIGSDVDRERLRQDALRDIAMCESAGSFSDLRKRLEALKALLEDLPRFGLRLLRRTKKRVRRLLRAARNDRGAPCQDALCGGTLRAMRLALVRIERPPDKHPMPFGRSDLPPVSGREAKAVEVRLPCARLSASLIWRVRYSREESRET